MPRYLDLFTNFGFKSDIIEDAFSLSELAKMQPEKRKEYEVSLKHYRDWVNTLDTAEAKGFEKGKKEEKIDIAKKLLDILDDETISLKTGLTKDEVKELRL